LSSVVNNFYVIFFGFFGNYLKIKSIIFVLGIGFGGDFGVIFGFFEVFWIKERKK
jgi:hypothetical protein